jgi:hypothetical protein
MLIRTDILMRRRAVIRQLSGSHMREDSSLRESNQPLNPQVHPLSDLLIKDQSDLS